MLANTEILSNPWQRSLILISTEVKIEALEYDSAGIELLNNQHISIIPIEQWSHYSNDINILGNLRPNPGMLLILSPYDNYTYSEISESRLLFSIAKMESTSTLCQLLGAKSVKTKEILVHNKIKEKEFKFDLEANSYDAKFGAKNTLLQDLKNRLELNSEFGGTDANIELAIAFLEESKLDSDIVLKSLVTRKNYESQGYNPLKKITREITLTSSLQNTFDSTLKINFPNGYVRGDYKSTIKEKLEAIVTLEIIFP